MRLQEDRVPSQGEKAEEHTRRKKNRDGETERERERRHDAICSLSTASQMWSGT